MVNPKLSLYQQLLTDIQAAFYRWENGHPFDAHGPERALQREIDSLLREEPAKPRFAFDYPEEVIAAHWWIKTYCRHHATLGIDQQCLDGMPKLPSDNTPYTPDQQTAHRHLATLREAGLLMESGFFKNNFVVRDL